MNIQTKFVLFVIGFVGLIAIIVRLYPLTIPGFKVTSWFRGIDHNERIGGVTGSWHLLGWAIDGGPVTTENIKRFEDFFNDVVVYKTHIHGEFDLKKVIKGLFT